MGKIGVRSDEGGGVSLVSNGRVIARLDAHEAREMALEMLAQTVAVRARIECLALRVQPVAEASGSGVAAIDVSIAAMGDFRVHVPQQAVADGLRASGLFMPKPIGEA